MPKKLRKVLPWRRRLQQQALVQRFSQWVGGRRFVVSEQPGVCRATADASGLVPEPQGL
jgi:hypothetical protein